MPAAQDIYTQICKITRVLNELSLADEYNFPINNNGNIVYTGMQNISIAMKNIAYEEIYKNFNETRNYNIKMLDGALIQILYRFKNNNLVSHRLAFFPSPNLESFQNEPKLYEEDEVYADILAKNIVTFPFRFDYDPDNFIDIEHPKTHITFGQYKNCRIPVSEPLTPEIFILFILRNFYNTAFHQFTSKLSISSHRFNPTISNNEEKLLHLCIK